MAVAYSVQKDSIALLEEGGIMLGSGGHVGLVVSGLMVIRFSV